MSTLVSWSETSRHYPSTSRVEALARIGALLALVLTLAWQINSTPEGATARAQSNLQFETIMLTPWGVEGLVADDAGNVFTAGRAVDVPCPVWRIPVASPSLIEIGTVPQPCSPSGLVISGAELLFVDSGNLWSVPVGATSSAPATQVASGMPGANALAVDRAGNRYVSDGTTGQGRVWRVSPQGEVTLLLRVPSMANDAILEDELGGVGRDHRALPQGQIRITATGRTAANTEGSQPIVANGLAFDGQGDLLIADTARGAIWRARFDSQGNLVTPTGCDTTYPAETVCMEALWVAHPLLEGADGVVFHANGDLWVAANERNALVVVRPEGRFAAVTEVFRNPPNADTWLRNEGPLEFPTGITLSRNRVCVSHTDTGRRDNAPPAGGETDPQGPMRGKVNCATVD